MGIIWNGVCLLYTSKTDFLKKTIALADAQAKDCLPMSGAVKDGSGNTTFTLSAGSNTGMTAQLLSLIHIY